MTTTNSADIGRLLQSAAAADPTLAKRLADAGVDPDSVSGPDDLVVIPVQSKDERVAARDHVLGGGVPRRIFQSPGPIYETQPDGDDPWRWREVLESAGLKPADIVLNCFGYHLSPAGAMFDEAVVAAGATVLPGGIGNQQLQVQAIRDLGIRGYVGLPSYLKALIDLFEADGGTPADMPLQYAVVTAEPLPDSLRTELEAWVPSVRMAYGSAEAGLISYEDGHGAGMVTAADIVVDVCGIADGTPMTTDAPGEVVVSILRDTAPLVRFGTGDLSAWVTDGGEPVLTDGRRRLAGVLGRTGQATKVRGMFLHPTQVKAVAAKLAGVEALRFLIGRENHKDTIVAEVVVADGADREAASSEAADLIRAELRFRAEVRVVDAIDGDDVIVDDRSWD